MAAPEHCGDLGFGRSARAAAPASSPSRSATMVDSSPRPLGPPSSTAAIRPSSPAITCSAVVGLTAPLRIGRGRGERQSGLGRAVRASPDAPGTRSAIVSSPAVTAGAIARVAFLRQHQGQRAGPERAPPVRARDRRTSPAASPSARSSTWTISGLKSGRPLAAIDRGHRLGAVGAGGEAVDRLGRHRDQLAWPISAAARSIPPVSVGSAVRCHLPLMRRAAIGGAPAKPSESAA